jgi:hypothetical protein
MEVHRAIRLSWHYDYFSIISGKTVPMSVSTSVRTICVLQQMLANKLIFRSSVLLTSVADCST